MYVCLVGGGRLRCIYSRSGEVVESTIPHSNPPTHTQKLSYTTPPTFNLDYRITSSSRPTDHCHYPNMTDSHRKWAIDIS